MALFTYGRLSRSLPWPIAACALAFASGCGDLSGPSRDEKVVRVSGTGFVLQPGDTALLFARQAKRAEGDRTVSPELVTPIWSSDNEEVVTIDAAGVLRAHSPGRATVWAQVGEARDSASVRVRAPGDLPRARWRTVSVGLTYVCALTIEGKPYCWGTNYFAELGTGSRRQHTVYLSPTPVRDAPVMQRVRVVGIHSACGLTAAGEAWCWGYRGTSATGEVGREIAHRTPTRVRFSGTVRDIVGGLGHGCLLDDGGRAFCWGSNLFGELGTGTWDESRIPAAVATDERFVRLDLVGTSSCGLTTEAKVYCWGNHQAGRVGVGETGVLAYNSPQPVASGLTFRDAAVECAIEVGGGTWCWGSSLGLEGVNWWADERIVPWPARLVHDPGFERIWTAETLRCGLTAEGTAYCWGMAMRGALGSTESTGEICSETLLSPCSSRPLPVAGGQRFVELSVGRYTVCGITSEEELYCWGSNDTTAPGHPDRDRGPLLGGLLGDGTTREYSAIPIRVEDPDH